MNSDYCNGEQLANIGLASQVYFLTPREQPFTLNTVYTLQG